jgi:hypothetical protein
MVQIGIFCIIYLIYFTTTQCQPICVSLNVVALIDSCINLNVPIPVAERSKAWVCSRSPAEIADLNPTEGMDVCLL